MKRSFILTELFSDACIRNSAAALPKTTAWLLYQSGYLTIESYDKRRGRFTLAFPNEEVKNGFIHKSARMDVL